MSSKKKTLLLTGFFSLFVLFALSVVSAATDSSKQVDKQRPPVAFTHDDHMGSYECLDCHHRYDEDGENIQDEDELNDGDSDDIIMLNTVREELNEINCASCHNEDKKIIKSREAFHRQCIGCHEKEATGPVLCGECHLRSNQASADE